MRDILSRISFEQIVYDIISWMIIAVLGAAIVYLYKRLRQFVSSTAEGGRRQARADIRERVRSDEYFAECQKNELRALIMAAGGFVSVISLLPHYQLGQIGGALQIPHVLWVMIFFTYSGGLLIFLEVRRNAAALKMRMRREERRRAKRLSANIN